jgi:hypothetical protein
MTVSKITVLYLHLLFLAPILTMLFAGEEQGNIHVHQKQQHLHDVTSFQFYSRFNWQNLPVLRVPSREVTESEGLDTHKMVRKIKTAPISIGESIFMPLNGPFVAYNTTLPKDSYIIEFAVESFEEGIESNGEPEPTAAQPHVCHAWLQVPSCSFPLTISQGMNRMVTPDGFGVRVLHGPEWPLQLSLQIENQNIVSPPVKIRFEFTITYTMEPRVDLLLDSLYVYAFGFTEMPTLPLSLSSSSSSSSSSSLLQPPAPPISTTDLPGEYPTTDEVSPDVQSSVQKQWLQSHWLKQESEKSKNGQSKDQQSGGGKGMMQPRMKMNEGGGGHKERLWGAGSSFLVPPGLHSFSTAPLPHTPLFHAKEVTGGGGNSRILFIKTHLHVHAGLFI